VLPSKFEESSLVAHELTNRVSTLARGVIPATAQHITAAVDLGKYLAHWIVVAWSPGACGHIVDYGRIEVASDEIGVEKATLLALREFRDLATGGWPSEGPGQAKQGPNVVWIDAGYMTSVVYAFCRENHQLFLPAV